MTVIPIPAFTDNYIWALVDKNTSVFDCIDPGDAQPVLHFAQEQQLQLRTILITHHHQDHIGGIMQLKEQFPAASVYGPQDSRITVLTHTLARDEHLAVGMLSFIILSNPGHTSTHISYYEPKKQWLFCGDTLFSAGCGRVFDGTIEQLHHSLLLFKALAPGTKIFCAHEYTLNNLKFAQTVEPNNQAIQHHIHQLQNNAASCSLPSTLEQELLINPFLRTEVAAVQQYALHHGALSATSLDVFRVLREQKNRF